MATMEATLAVGSTDTATQRVITHFSPRAVHRRRAVVEFIVALAMAVGCILLFWGSNFAKNMVHDQLSDQKISFPAANSPGLPATEFPSLQRYGGQAVDNGPKAKAYANEYIAVHLKGVNAGKTYSETSGMAIAARTKATAAAKANDPNATTLATAATTLEGQAQTLFRGETLRGLLLYAWGWGLVAEIAQWVAVAALVGAIALLALAVYGVVQYRRDPALN
jgi:hypothetical protein